MPETFRIGLLGHGTVGAAFEQLLAERADAFVSITGMRPEMRAIWEPAVETAREMLTPDELRSCVEFLTRALEMVSCAASDPSAAVEEPPAEAGRAR